MAYGVRNYADIAAGYREMARILRPGGMVAVLELSTPVSPITRPLYKLYTRMLIPHGREVRIGRQQGLFLPSRESIAAAPQRESMTAIMNAAGFDKASFKSLHFLAYVRYI